MSAVYVWWFEEGIERAGGTRFVLRRIKDSMHLRLSTGMLPRAALGPAWGARRWPSPPRRTQAIDLSLLPPRRCHMTDDLVAQLMEPSTSQMEHDYSMDLLT